MVIGIIGGGASGMMAALCACGNPENRVILFERQSRLGRKLMATGNGRCNLSNRAASVEHYHGRDPGFVAPCLERFGVEDTLAFFRDLGLVTVTEPDGKIYPFSDQANSVSDVLRLALEASDAELRLGCEIRELRQDSGGFTAVWDGGEERLDRVIVAAGGLAGRQLGGSDAGYELLASLGHRCTRLYPSLVQLRTDPTWVRSCKGVRAQAQATLLQGEQVLAEETGEVQFTDFGVSGPCIFSLARACAGRRGMLAVVLDLCPCLDETELIAHLTERRERFPALTLENYLTGLLHNRLGRTVLRERKLALTQTAASLTGADIARIAAGIKAFRIEVLGPMDLSQAQVTAGGMKTSEFDPVTLESKLVPGLYATGEVLDVDGDCGGYNLQWAWSSGYTAGLTLHRENPA
jgi:hypothetical protein